MALSRTSMKRKTSSLSRTSLKRTGGKIKSKPVSSEKKREQSENIAKMWSMFIEIWNERPHRSEVSSVTLGYEPKGTMFHHILPKCKYPELAYEKDNIILMYPEEHAIVEMDIYRYPEVNKRREQLKQKYNL